MGMGLVAGDSTRQSDMPLGRGPDDTRRGARLLTKLVTGYR